MAGIGRLQEGECGIMFVDKVVGSGEPPRHGQKVTIR